MFASHTLMVVFTIVFAATGLYSLVRFAALVSDAEADGGRVAELAHLLRSIAMIAMTWAFSGSPDTGSGILQIVVIGLIGLWFLIRIAGHGHGHGRIASAYHLVMAAAMVWMVAAMPVLTSGSGEVVSMSAGSDTHGDHGSMAGMDGMAGCTARTAPPAWQACVRWSTRRPGRG